MFFDTVVVFPDCWTDRVDVLARVQTRLSSTKVTEDLEGVSGAALIGVDPVLSCRGRQRKEVGKCKSLTLTLKDVHSSSSWYWYKCQDQLPGLFWVLWFVSVTVFEVGLAEVQVLAGARGAVLSAQRETHRLDLLTEGVERAKDLLHAFAAHQELCAGGVRCRHVRVKLRRQLAGIDGAFGLGTPLDGQRLNDLTRWALGSKFTSLTAVQRAHGEDLNEERWSTNRRSRRSLYSFFSLWSSSSLNPAGKGKKHYIITSIHLWILLTLHSC